MEKKWFHPRTFFTFVCITIGVAILSTIMIVLCIPLIPFRSLRIKICNIYGTTVSYMVFFFIGLRVKVDRQKMKELHPAIYIFNHTTNLDAFLTMGSIPIGTVGVAKKEIVYVPFFGWLYALSGHLLVDRKNRERAIKSMKIIGDVVRKHRLGIAIYPEGTRSKSGHLQKLKKGFVHIALATKLPIVPVLLHNAHQKWTRKSSLNFQIKQLDVEILEPIDTSNWQEEQISEYIEQIWQILNNGLSKEQKFIEGDEGGKRNK